jgi:hypothetical protein
MLSVVLQSIILAIELSLCRRLSFLVTRPGTGATRRSRATAPSSKTTGCRIYNVGNVVGRSNWPLREPWDDAPVADFEHA